jgi:hypothetical protein
MNLTILRSGARRRGGDMIRPQESSDGGQHLGATADNHAASSTRATRRTGRRRSLTAVAALAGSLALVGGPVATSSAQAATLGPVTTNCGYVTCSAYLSRSATRAVYQKVVLAGGFYGGGVIAVCYPFGPTPLGAACAAALAVNGGWIWQEVQDAATQHGARGACLKVTYTRSAGGLRAITWWSTNNGQYCHD